jgi:hypothetical protein
MRGNGGRSDYERDDDQPHQRIPQDARANAQT